MRTHLWLSIGLAASLGACSQSLSGNLTGAGGAGAMADNETGSGGKVGAGSGGKVGTGAGGTTGYDAAVCAGISAEYDAAMTAALTCTAGATGQCMQVVRGSLSPCGIACPAFVTDASKLNVIEKMWVAANCDRPVPAPPCVSVGQCPAGIADVCIAGADGRGVCSYAGGGTGGSSGGTGGRGASGAGGSTAADAGVPDETCAAYASKYAAALNLQKSCTVNAANQCAHAVAPSLSVCSGGCTTYVNDSTELDLIRQLWQEAGCNRATVACPAIACLPPAGSVCTQTDAGGGTCTSYYPL
ncbi:MAG TPA: hypothetical protein VHM31_13500 [Polyangia bacterium]|nr:hypothetical protein [Polyangia bacterium]